MELKHGKRLKRRHKEFLNSQDLNHKDYLIVKDTPKLMEFVNRATSRRLVFRHES